MGDPVTCMGIDVGGTFTDAVLAEGSTIWRAKSPTVPGDVGRSVIDACRLVAARAGVALEELLPRVARFGLGTTAVTNVLAARSGARVGLVTTAGFEDELPLAKGRRVSDGVWSLVPDPIVPRSHIAGVRERVDREGRVVVPLDPDEVVEAARRLVEEHEVESLAISFLWSFRNPRHEEQAVGALADAMPEVPVVSGAALQPSIREFERTAYAALNAYVAPALRGIDRLAEELESLGLIAPVLLVQSNGGSTSIAEARRAPIVLAASGPAAGVAASVSVAAASRISDVVTCDMGGTSFDVAVVTGGRTPRRGRSEIAGLLTALSMVEVESIGAGGGSVGWVDARGMLRVGPHSAGAVPGPACYGRGGTEATVTDALVVLGYIDPDRFLGGDMGLDADLARAACARLGAQIGLDAEECAWGIRRLALDGMTTAVRSLLDVRGLEPSGHAIASYGGCGALFTTDIAQALGMPRVLVPGLASVLSAFGAATADVRHERVRSLATSLPGDCDALAKVAAELRDEVLADLAVDDLAGGEPTVRFEADLRFKRQVWELTVPIPGDLVDEAAIDALIEDFRAEYVRRYGAGSMMLGAPVELVTLRAVGLSPTVKPDVAGRRRRGVTAGTVPAPAGRRSVRTGRGRRGRAAVPVFDAADLLPGHAIEGPALVDGSDTTMWVPDGCRAVVERSGTVAVEVRAGNGPVADADAAFDDPIALELLRSQLQAVVEEAAGAIERTAISPVVTESKDYSATLLDAGGGLVAGGGVITYHWVAATRAIRATIERYGGSIKPGDVYLANDPYDGGGLHPNDVFVQRPIFVGEELVGWAALSAHLIDMGGMAMGSFAPAATECYQEALRIPPVRILREGVEVSDVWDIFRTNVRLDVLVEMDLRGLVAGANVAHDKVVDLVARLQGGEAPGAGRSAKARSGGRPSAKGTARYAAGIAALQALSERELRRRIARIADGVYRYCSWVEWDEDLFAVPCALTVDGDRLHFDFSGAAPQTTHFFNSKPYIVKSGFMMQAAWLLAPDLPYTEGLLAPVSLHCPEGSIVNSVPPAPINAGHIHVAFAATEVMMQCLRLALWATPDSPCPCPVAGHGGYSAIALSTWSGMGLDGVPDTWMLMDGAWTGGSAAEDRDGPDMGSAIGTPQPAQWPDVEILESWYPMLIGERRVRQGVNGPGRFRSGGGDYVTFRPHGTAELVGQMIAMRAYVPLEGAAGGLPGATTVLRIRSADGHTRPVSTAAAGVRVPEGAWFEIECASGGGVGDPVGRDPVAVAGDVAEGRISAHEATDVYGVVIGPSGVDQRATTRRRKAMRVDRLRRARPPAAAIAPPPPGETVSPSAGNGAVTPLYPGVVQRGTTAFSEASGAALGQAPGHWTDGCPVLEWRIGSTGPEVLARAYLDPETGTFLHVEVVPGGTTRSFEVSPARWTAAAGGGRAGGRPAPRRRAHSTASR